MRHYATKDCPGIRRRALLQALGSLGVVGASGLLQACDPYPAAESETRVLAAPGFTPRMVARSGVSPVARSKHRWHAAPDGGGTFPTHDGGWIYVSNSELGKGGGAGALQFDANGTVVKSYPVLSGTRDNCAGGTTPWRTWLSCEETGTGIVWECDPYGREPAQPRPALGVFCHEAACVDPDTLQIYMTEDRRSGRFYRFTPYRVGADGRPDLQDGLLEVAALHDGVVSWLPLPDPGARYTSTRRQAAGSAGFNGGEGVFWHAGVVYFATKGDNRLWAYDTLSQTLRVLHHAGGLLRNVDTIIVSARGDVYVAEDGSQMRITVFPAGGGAPTVLVQILGHRDSEITGLAFDPSGTRLYFSSQRGNSGRDGDGVTYELSGPFDHVARAARMVQWEVDIA